MTDTSDVPAWVEGKITKDGLNLSLMSAKADGSTRVEAIEHISAEDMELRGGETFIMQAKAQSTDEPSPSDSLPEPGDVLTDENAPSWSANDWVEVIEVLPDARADEYVIQGENEHSVVPVGEQSWTDETVADANPSYPPDDAVVLAQYEGSGDWYAFPASRLV